MQRCNQIALDLSPIVIIAAAGLGWINWFVMKPVVADLALLPPYKWLYLAVVLAPVWPALLLKRHAARYGARRRIISGNLLKWVELCWFVLLLTIVTIWLAWAVDFDSRIAESGLEITFTGYVLVVVLAAMTARTYENSRWGSPITTGWLGAILLGLLAAFLLFVLATPFLTLGGLYGPPFWILVMPITLHILLLMRTRGHWSTYLIPDASNANRGRKDERKPLHAAKNACEFGAARATLLCFVLWLTILAPVFILLMALLLDEQDSGPAFIIGTAGLVVVSLGWLLLLLGRVLYWLRALTTELDAEQPDARIRSKPDASLAFRPSASGPDEQPGRPNVFPVDRMAFSMPFLPTVALRNLCSLANSNLRAMRHRIRKGAGIVELGTLALLLLSCPRTTSQRLAADLALVSHTRLPVTADADSTFAKNVERIADENGVRSRVIERPSYDGDVTMKIAVLFSDAFDDQAGLVLNPVGVVPGSTGGAFVYMDYACSLAAAGYVVFLPDIQGEYVHLFGMNPLSDPLVSVDLSGVRTDISDLRTQLAEYAGAESIDMFGVLELYQSVFGGSSQDQALCDTFRDCLFANRVYSLDMVVRSMFEENNDPVSPLYGKIDTNSIGLEGHSMGCDEILESLVPENDIPRYWWSENIKVAILKAAQTSLHGPENFRAITAPVFFITGECDSAKYIIEPNWAHFNTLQSPSGYLILFNAGHFVFVDAPYGFFLDKFVPILGDIEHVDLASFERNRTAILAASVEIYDTYLGRRSTAAEMATPEILDFPGEYYTRNMR